METIKRPASTPRDTRTHQRGHPTAESRRNAASVVGSRDCSGRSRLVKPPVRLEHLEVQARYAGKAVGLAWLGGAGCIRRVPSWRRSRLLPGTWRRWDRGRPGHRRGLGCGRPHAPNRQAVRACSGRTLGAPLEISRGGFGRRPPDVSDLRPLGPVGGVAVLAWLLVSAASSSTRRCRGSDVGEAPRHGALMSEAPARRDSRGRDRAGNSGLSEGSKSGCSAARSGRKYAGRAEAAPPAHDQRAVPARTR